MWKTLMDQFNDRLRQQKTSLQRHIEKIQPWVTDKNYSDVQHKRLEEYVYSCRSIRRNRQKQKKYQEELGKSQRSLD